MGRVEGEGDLVQDGFGGRREFFKKRNLFKNGSSEGGVQLRRDLVSYGLGKQWDLVKN